MAVISVEEVNLQVLLWKNKRVSTRSVTTVRAPQNLSGILPTLMLVRPLASYGSSKNGYDVVYHDMNNQQMRMVQQNNNNS